MEYDDGLTLDDVEFIHQTLQNGIDILPNALTKSVMKYTPASDICELHVAYSSPTWKADLVDFIKRFNMSDRDGYMLYCDQNPRLSHDEVSRELIRVLRQKNFDYKGMYRSETGKLYYGWSFTPNRIYGYDELKSYEKQRVKEYVNKTIQVPQGLPESEWKVYTKGSSCEYLCKYICSPLGWIPRLRLLVKSFNEGKRQGDMIYTNMNPRAIRHDDVTDIVVETLKSIGWDYVYEYISEDGTPVRGWKQVK